MCSCYVYSVALTLVVTLKRKAIHIYHIYLFHAIAGTLITLWSKDISS